MSTQLWGANPGFNLEGVTNGTGSATTSHSVELTVDMATTIVNDSGTTRQIYKQEVLIILELFMQFIVRQNWPPVSS